MRKMSLLGKGVGLGAKKIEKFSLGLVLGTRSVAGFSISSSEKFVSFFW